MIQFLEGRGCGGGWEVVTAAVDTARRIAPPEHRRGLDIRRRGCRGRLFRFTAAELLRPEGAPLPGRVGGSGRYVAGGDRSGQEMGLRQQWLVTWGGSHDGFEGDLGSFNEYRQILPHPGPSASLHENFGRDPEP